ncbi:MAG: barstar family protein [Elusimicrobiales bacterium]
MKVIHNVIAISIFLSAAAHAGQPAGALGALLSEPAARAAAAAVPAARPAPVFPEGLSERSLASDVLDLTPSNASFLSAYAGSLGYAVFELDGSRMRTKSALLVHAGTALRLPGVPETWDALIDYLGEMRSIHSNSHILVVVRNAGAIERADRALYADLREVAEFTCRNAREWSKGDITMKFAFVR